MSGHEHHGMDHSMHQHSMGGEEGGKVQMMEMMQMTFYASTKVTLLFEWWETENLNGLLISCLVVLIMGVVYEGIKSFREHLKAKSGHQGSASSLIANSSQPWLKSMFSSHHLLQTILYGAQTGMAYLLMLLFMAYNVYVCIAVVLGIMLGFFVFGWCASKTDTSDHCG